MARVVDIHAIHAALGEGNLYEAGKSSGRKLGPVVVEVNGLLRPNDLEVFARGRGV